MVMRYQLLCKWILSFRKSSDQPSTLFAFRGGALIYFLNIIFPQQN